MTLSVPPNIGEEIYKLAAEIFPICRSITGAGVRETLAALDRHAPLTVSEIPTGTKVLDWEIPKEWVIRDAWIKNAAGEKVLDFKRHSLHVLNYSAPVHARLALAELKQSIFTLPNQPDLIPYRTSYYAERSGFCMSHNALAALPDGEYEAFIDSELKDGALTYAEHVHEGARKEEVLISAHICHPSLANDNCSGLALAALLAKALFGVKTRYTYRFIFAPGTIGAIAWLARNEDKTGLVRHGIILSGVGDTGAPTFKRTQRGDAKIDRVMAHVLSTRANAKLVDFIPYGYDERQYNSPGFKLPVGLFQRSVFGSYPEYHTSADDLSFISPANLEDSFRVIAEAIDVIERDATFINTHPKGEPQLGRRGLYDAIGGDKDAYAKNMAMLWVLNQSNGERSLLDIAERSGIPFATIRAVADVLLEKGLLAPGDTEI